MAEKNLRRYLTLKRSKFRPVREVMVGDPNFTRKSLSNGTKALVEDDANEMRRDELLSLEKEGQMFRHHTCESAGLGGRTLLQLPEEHRRFVTNGAVATLPHNANLQLWKKRQDNKCPLCGERQSLIHVLNTCPVALNARRFNQHHDVVLKKITTTVSSSLKPTH